MTRSGRDLDTVLYTHVFADDNVDDGNLSHEEEDEVVIERKSLISNKNPANGPTRKTKSFRLGDVKRRSPLSFFVIGTIFFIAGLITGFLIGRFVNHSQQNSDPKDQSDAVQYSNRCNCSNLLTNTHLSSTEPTSSKADDDDILPKEMYSTTTEETTRPVTNKKFRCSTTTQNFKNSCNDCKTRNPVKTLGNESIKSLFAPMTVEEMKAVVIAMKTNGYVAYDSTFWSNRLSHVYLYPAVKLDALRFLDDSGSFPGRFAKVHVFRPVNEPPDVMEYRVGPLNESFENMKIEKLRKDGEISFNRRPYDVFETNELYQLLEPELKAIASLLFESFDGVNGTEDTSPVFSYLPTTNLSDRTSSMVLELEIGTSSTLRLLPVSCTVHHPGSNVSNWHTSDWYYLNQGPYMSSIELQRAYDLNNFRKIKFSEKYRKQHKGDFDRVRNTSLPARDLSDIPPPRTYEPQGPRYSIEGHKVSWMGWQFEVSSDPVRGPAVFNVKFKGQRIAYEISLQDITLLYSSQTNGHGPPVLSDTFYLIGAYHKPIIDVDCPKRSKILKATIFEAGSPIEMDAICVFEADGQRPLWRHGSRGLADNYLVIRAPISVGNYDYIFEWNFCLDGRLLTKLTASGYLYGAFWDHDDHQFAADDNSFTPFGYRLGDYLLGPIHDHTFTFKIDLDIYGTKNSFQTINWKAGRTKDAFQSASNISHKPSYFFFNNTRFVTREILKQENSFVLHTEKPKIWTVVNENKKNNWGTVKGYRVIPQSKYAEILEDHMMLQVWDQIKYQLAVTKRKESEQYATNSLYETTHPLKMYNSSQMKLDNDTIRNEDIVLWVSEKFYHLPTAEDVPMTLPVEAGFTLKPFNYFDRTPVFDLPARYSNNEPYDIKSCYVTD